MKDTGRELFGKRLSRLRMDKGYKTQGEFSEKLGVPLNTYKKWEQGAKLPSKTNMKKIIDLTGCDPEYFSGEIDQKNYDIQFICENTGLTGPAVEMLQNISRKSPETLEVLNYILETQISMEEPEDSILYKIRELLMYEAVFKDRDEKTPVYLLGMDSPPVTVGSFNKMYSQHYYNQVTQDLADQRRKHLFYKWQNGIKEYKYRNK